MVDRKETAWCTMCGARFTHAEIDGATACPKCGDKGIPCDPNEDMRVVVNWHELRVLGIWAENWAQHCQRQSPGESGQARPEVIHAIARRLERQYPSGVSLTLSGEIMQVKNHGVGIEGYGVAKQGPLPVNGPGAIAPTSNG